MGLQADLNGWVGRPLTDGMIDHIMSQVKPNGFKPTFTFLASMPPSAMPELTSNGFADRETVPECPHTPQELAAQIWAKIVEWRGKGIPDEEWARWCQDYIATVIWEFARPLAWHLDTGIHGVESLRSAYHAVAQRFGVDAISSTPALSRWLLVARAAYNQSLQR